MAPNSEAGSLTENIETIKNCRTELIKISSVIESLNLKIANLKVKVTELVNEIESFSKAKVYDDPKYSNTNHVHTKYKPAPLQPSTTSSSNPTPDPSTCLFIGDSSTKYVNPRYPNMKVVRVPTYTINDIDPSRCYGYNRIWVHVGINSLKSNFCHCPQDVHD